MQLGTSTEMQAFQHACVGTLADMHQSTYVYMCYRRKVYVYKHTLLGDTHVHVVVWEFVVSFYHIPCAIDIILPLLWSVKYMYVFAAGLRRGNKTHQFFTSIFVATVNPTNSWLEYVHCTCMYADATHEKAESLRCLTLL